jgi:hypothetical protein
VHNPFNKASNDELTFLGRSVDSPVSYRRDNFELYGPMWIFVTLIVEFVILGHLTNQLNLKTQATQELLDMMKARTADQSLKRIMKITFLLACFYFGNPFVTYLMLKGKNAIEVTYAMQLSHFAYAYAPFVPVSLLLFIL